MTNVPVFIGSTSVDNGAATATPTITTSADVTAGDAILVNLNVYVGSTSFSSVTDGGDTFASVGTTVNTLIVRTAYCLSSAGLASGGSIVVNLTGAPGIGYYSVSAFKIVGGLASLDVSATNSVTTAGTSLAAGTTAATAQAVELVMAAFGAFSGAPVPTFTAGGAFTALTAASSAGTDGNAVWSEYLITAATGTQSPTGSLNANASYYAGVTTVFTYPTRVLYAPRTILQAVNRSTRWHHREPMERRPSGLLIPLLRSYLPGKTLLRKAA